MSSMLGSLFLLLLASSALPSAEAAQSKAYLKSCLQSAGVSYVDSSSGQSFTDAKKPFNQRLQYTPIAVAFPTSAQQVSAAVDCGRDAMFWINARSGGHSYAAMALGGEDNHFVIDLKAMKSVTVNGEQATIGGGARLGDVGVALSAQGRAMANGVCPYVGIGGHASYGGFGFFSRSWGLVVDQIASMEVVIGDGSIKTVSATQNSDLFWALRGAGGSYGIITAFTVNTHAAPSTAVYSEYRYNDQSASSAASIVQKWQDFSSSSSLPAAFGGTFNVFKGSKANTISLSLTATYIGSQDEFLSVISSLVNGLPTPSSKKVTSQNWKATLQLLAGNQNLDTSQASDYTDTFYAKSLMTPASNPMTASAIGSWMNYISTTGYSSKTNWFIQIELYGGANSAINKVAADATAFVHRSSLFTIQLYASSSSYGPPYPSDGISFVNGLLTSLANPMGSSWKYEAYQNYIDPQLSQSDANRLYYGANYARLQSIKKTYDPRNIYKAGPSQAIVGA